MKRRVIIGCPGCGDQRVDIADVTIRECLDNAAWSYRSRCPKCKLLFAEETTRGAALRCIASGAEVEFWELPSEIDARPVGPPLTDGDLEQFCYLLQTTESLVQLAAGGDQQV